MHTATLRIQVGIVAVGLSACGCGADPGSSNEVTELSSAASSHLSVNTTSDSNGASTTASPNAIDLSTANPFFSNFGTNGRACGTCHHQEQGWTVTPVFAQTLAAADPLFVFDGSDCLPPGASNGNPTLNSTEMLNFGDIRIDLAIPSTADYQLIGYNDPHNCPTAPSAADLRFYRRPLPASNTAFLATIMWDGRENVAPTVFADLQHQSNDATLGHAQATSPLSSANQTSIVNFETGLFNAQQKVGSMSLTAHGANGGGAYLDTDVLPAFFIGINDPFKPGFTGNVFTVFHAWETPGAGHTVEADAIGRGEIVFNTIPITITNVPGLNGPNDASQAPIAGFCGTCHDNPNVGNHSVSLQIDIGITAASPVGSLDVSHLPAYTFQQNGTGATVTLTDGGRGIITGRFKDLGKTKGPNLRALATRAPYFHNGSAKDLATVVDFYDARFAVGFTAQQKSDLVEFLNAL